MSAVTADGERPDEPAAHATPFEGVAATLGVDPSRGLKSVDVAERRARYGPNEVEQVRRSSIWSIVWDAVSEPFVVLLFVAGVLAILYYGVATMTLGSSAGTLVVAALRQRMPSLFDAADRHRAHA